MTDLFSYISERQGPKGIPEDVSRMFEEIALRLAHDEGFKRFSADAILHEIRWRNRVKWIAGEFKCNDHWSAPLARWFLDRHADLKATKFFELRQTRSEAA